MKLTEKEIRFSPYSLSTSATFAGTVFKFEFL
jgi:hypothetical protein